MAARFYWVFNTTTKGQPSVRHDTEAKARAEAERLARKEPGHSFVVMAALASYRSEPQPPPPVSKVEHNTPVWVNPIYRGVDWGRLGA